MRQPSTETEEAEIGLRFIYRAGASSDAPLVYFVHGRAGTRDVMWAFERIVPQAAAIVAFEAFLPDQLGGFSWWDVNDTALNSDQLREQGLGCSSTSVVGKDSHLIATESHSVSTDPQDPAVIQQALPRSLSSRMPRAEAIAGAVERFAQASERFERHFALSPVKRIAVGFSQGAALLSSLMLSGAVRLDVVALLAGFVVEPAAVRLANRPRVFVGHGTKDEVVGIERAREGVSRLRELGLTVDFIHDDVGHKIGSQAMRALQTWIAGTLT